MPAAKRSHTKKTPHPLCVFSGSANRPLAEAVARALKARLGVCHTTQLPDSETHVIIEDSVRGDDIFPIQPCGVPVNDHLMELFLYVDAFRRAPAHSITAVVPLFPLRATGERMACGR
ncbi:MAG: ribose-phosphate pyrophosphokinase-like domain-containing protein [Candidatus Eisenbacteria bacterium]